MRDPDFFLSRYAPVTTEFSVISTALDAVLDHWIGWHRGIWEQYNWKVPLVPVQGSLANKLDALLPLDSQARLLTETADGQLAVFCNFSQTNGSSDAKYLARQFKLTETRVVLADGKRNGNIESTDSVQFDITDYAAPVVDGWRPAGRSVAAHKESRWEWHEHGPPYPFEDLEAYKAKRIKDRLTPEMVEAYCNHLGIALFDPDYYCGKAVITRIRDVLPGALLKYPNQ
jgi:hypothetical protein